MRERVTIRQGDALTWAAEYDGPPFHAALMDPPYHLHNGMTKPRPDMAEYDAGNGNPYCRSQARTGFMNSAWDGGDIAFRPETWAALARHLYPGAFIMAFAGTRGYHRMACAMEDAGLILHPMLVWIFGSGFPKATRIDTQIDKAAGSNGQRSVAEDASRKRVMANAMTQGGAALYEPATDLARAWAGHRYGLQALKPALECIAVAQVPYRGRPVDCITRTGAGALNVDGGRIEANWQTDPTKRGWQGRKAPDRGMFSDGLNVRAEHSKPHNGGRWPSNLMLDDSPEVAAMFPQTGPADKRTEYAVQKRTNGSFDTGFKNLQGAIYQDEGSAARFFFQSDWQAEVFEQIEQADPGVYVAKAGRRERDAGLERHPVIRAGSISGGGGIHSTGDHAWGRNHHPTVKPLRLMRYLATLLLPPAAYAPRRLLQPFSGSGSEAIGAALAGWEEVTGIEQSIEYCELARARAAWWQGHVGLFEQITAEDEAAAAAQEATA